MKKIFIFCLLFLIYYPCYSHDYDVELKPKLKKVKLSTEAIQTLGIKIKEVKEEAIDLTVRTTGQIEEIPKNRFDVNIPVQGKVISVLVDIGDVVSTGDSLVLIESTEITKLVSEISQLKAELELAQSVYEREKTLFEKGITAKKEFEASKTTLASTEAKLKASENNLKILTGSDLAFLEPGNFTIKAKKAGTIIERDLTVGQVLAPHQTIFKGVDLKEVWASADIYEKDIPRVMLGQEVFVTLDDGQEKIFKGKLTYLGSVINKETRTLPVKAVLQNPVEALHATPLRPGAFIQMEIHTGKKKKSIVIPRAALAEIDKEGTEDMHEHTVYVKEARKNLFIPRGIQVEPHDSNTVEVLSGLKAGEIIVTEGAYQLGYGKKKSKL